MKKTAIPDTSCLIALDKLNHLHLLRDLFDSILITPDIQEEFGAQLPDWIQVEQAGNQDKQHIFQTDVDQREASAIALALETANAILIIDEKRGRQLAERHQIHLIGTLRLLLFAKENGFINSIKPLIEQLVKSNFRINKAVIAKILVEANE